MPDAKDKTEVTPEFPDGIPLQANLSELARYLKLSPSTVSRVMNRTPGARSIPAETQDRIFSAAEKLNYRPNMVAKSLRKQSTYTLGVIVPELGEGYSATVLNGIENALVRNGYFFFVVSHMHRDQLLEEYPRLLLARAVEGIIAVDTPWNEPMRIPVVLISGHSSVAGVTNIVLNHERAAALALEHFVKLGHRRIAVIKGQDFSSDTETRWSAIQRVAQRMKLEIDPDLVVQLKGESATSLPGYVAAKDLLQRGKPFTAVFAFNDVSAIGSIRAIREAGLRVPEDVSIIGFDDIPSAAFQNPALTTIRQPLQTMGTLAVEHILGSIRGKEPANGSNSVTVEPELVVRNSTTTANPAR
ncbi:MAG: LacI family DNA-binding transcriptional regulator [Acidobacteriota bacterium]|nr:LacI family DNA-binding transcriptional regulator [Acidobacteriota bacterium]